MFTTCPQCALNLAVTVSDLRLGQGYVRCGRCSNVFSALASLSEEGDADEAPAVVPIVAPEELDTPDGDDDVDSIEVIEQEPTIDPTETTGENKQLRTGTFETIVLEGDGILQTEETVTESEVDAQLQALVQRFDAVREADEEAEAALLWPAAEDGAESDFDLGDGDAADALDLAEEPQPEVDADEAVLDLSPADGEPPPDETLPPARLTGAARESLEAPQSDFLARPETDPRAARRRTAWYAGSGVLALVLLGQLVHHFREDLVNTPGIGTALASLYAMFHVTLEPRWDLQAYEVRQLGAEAMPGDTPQIAVRASIRNRAPRTQPAPLLRVVLQDRYGNQVATREVAPPEYLKGNAAPRLAADQRVDANMLLPDPGQNAVGFEIDACLRGARGELRCASDTATH